MDLALTEWEKRFLSLIQYGVQTEYHIEYIDESEMPVQLIIPPSSFDTEIDQKCLD